MAEAQEAVLEFFRTRRSVPAKLLGEPGPDSDAIRQMVALATRVPDHGKLAPWRFIHYGRDQCRQLGQACLARALEMNSQMDATQQEQERTRFTRAPVVIAVVSTARQHPKIPVWEQQLSAGAVAMNLLCIANAHGWDGQWLTEWVAFDEVLAPQLGLVQGERIAGFIHLGTRTMPKTERDRPALDAIFTTIGG